MSDFPSDDKECNTISSDIRMKQKKMYINVIVKSISSRRKQFQSEKFYLEQKPNTVRELITECVKTSVKAYNQKLKQNDAAALSQEEIEAFSRFGKIAFGVLYGDKEADEDKAIETALQAFEDGLYRIFQDEESLESLDRTLEIKEDSKFMFVKLTMLVGSFF